MTDCQDLINLLETVQLNVTQNRLPIAECLALISEFKQVAAELHQQFNGLTIEFRLQNGYILNRWAQTATVVEGKILSDGTLTKVRVARKAATTTYNALILKQVKSLTLTTPPLKAWIKASSYSTWEGEDWFLFYQLPTTSPTANNAHRFKHLPTLVREELLTWETVHQSPYSTSCYNTTQIGWAQKPIGSLRISNHWNFHSKGRLHCPTTHPLPKSQQKAYHLGVFNGKTYDIVKSFIA